MPAIMALEGPPGTSALARRLVGTGRNIVGPLAGVTDTIKAHPLALVVGILAGAYFFTKGWTPGSIWGGHRAAQSREKALLGRRGLRGLGISKAEAYRQFKELYPPETFKRRGYIDRPMRDQAWNDYTDALAKDRQITMKQYNNWTSPWGNR